MFEVADEALPHASQEGDASHQPALQDGSGDPPGDTPPPQLAHAEPGLGLELVGGSGGDHVDHAAEGVAAIERPERPGHHLDSLEVEELGEHHRRTGQVDAVQVDGGARVGAGEDGVRPDASDRELGETGVLREGHPGRPAGEVLDARRLQCLEFGRREDAQAHRHRLGVAFAVLGCGDHHAVEGNDLENEGDAGRMAVDQAQGLPGGGVPGESGPHVIGAVAEAFEHECPRGVGERCSLEGTPKRDFRTREEHAVRIAHAPDDATHGWRRHNRGPRPARTASAATAKAARAGRRPQAEESAGDTIPPVLAPTNGHSPKPRRAAGGPSGVMSRQ